MKLKVALLFSVAIIVCTQPSSGQMIGDMIFLPASPDTNDSFSIDVYTFFTSAPCALVDSLTEINISNDTINIKAMYSIGFLTTTCLRNDTFNIGVLTAGTFFLHFELHIYEFNPSLQDIKDTIVTVVPATSIKENANDISIINLFPNPANDGFYVSYELTRNTYVHFRLFDYTGKEIITINEGYKPVGKYIEHIDTTPLAPGMYFLITNINGQIQSNKIIKL